MKTAPHIAVIGAGAAGMMAAIVAARSGARVTLLERQDRVGRKILATGNGRCNFTNAGAAAENYHSAGPGFVDSVLRRFPPGKAIEFFESLGALSAAEDQGRVYPLTGQASTILDVLRFEVERLAVKVVLHVDVREIARRETGFTLRWPDGEERVDRVIVTTGGKAAPHLGGTDSGVEILKHLGHRIVPVSPALVPLKARVERHLKGVRVAGRVTLEVSGDPPESEEGEILFTDYGLSGIPILQLSLDANPALLQHRQATLCLDLFPEWDAERLTAYLQDRFSRQPSAPLDAALLGLAHNRLIPAILREASIRDISASAHAIARADVGRIAAVLKRWTFEVTGSLSWNEAQLMAGGVSTAEFNDATLESRRVGGLYAAGEVLDVAGDCGGYNLQWAWSSGYVAGLHAARV